MAHVQRVQKKTSTMSLTISSCSSTASSSRDHFSCSPSSSSSSSSNLLTQKHSSLVQPLCVSPQRTQSPVYTQPAGGGVAPTFVKCLHDVTTLKGQLVVLECRLRGPPPLQVMWYREEEKILDSDDFRILRKKASSAPVPEELCTLVITEAFPEDSGLFKCVAINPFGTVSCCAALEVYHDMEEQLEMEAVHQQKMVSAQEDVEDMFHPGTSGRQSCEDSPPPFSDSMNPDPPDWPDVCVDDDVTAAVFPSPQLSTRCSEGPQVQTSASSPSPPPPSPPPSPPPPPPPPAKLFTPSKITFTSGGDNMNLSDLPTFTPTNFPPSAFNYERPRHFIQSQPSFQAPSYDSVVRDAQEYQNADPPGQGQGRSTPGHSASRSQSVSKSSSRFESMNQIQSQFTAQTGHQNQTNGLVKSSPSSGLSSPVPSSSSSTSALFTPVVCTSSSSAPRTTVRSTITLTPNVPSATGLGSATLPANQDGISAPAAYLCSVLPSQNAFPFSSSKLSPNSSLPPPSVSPPCSPLSPSSSSSSSFQQLNSQNRVQPAVVSLPAHYKGSPNTLPKPILKKSVAPRPSSSRSTDEDIQGSKDALIQDLEKKLRTKEARRRSTQKLSYEERMARRLLGPDNVSTVFDQDRLSDSQLDQPDSPEGKHTGGLWGRHHSGTDERGNEGSAIQEKCYAPRFLQIPPDLTVEEGRFCRVDFKVGGLPTPDVCWYLDGKAIRPDDYHKMLVCEKGLHSFIIEIVTVHHAGVYECVAKNRAGESRFSMRLDVIAQELLRPPTFVQKMSNSRALEGDTVRLECKVDASPPPQLFWKKDKDMMRLDPTRMSLYQDGSGRQCLLIERVLKSDAGWYTLSAINEAGMSTCNARLDVSARAGTALKTAPPGSKTLKLLSSLSHVPGPSSESAPQHTAPLYESAEL